MLEIVAEEEQSPFAAGDLDEPGGALARTLLVGRSAVVTGLELGGPRDGVAGEQDRPGAR